MAKLDRTLAVSVLASRQNMSLDHANDDREDMRLADRLDDCLTIGERLTWADDVELSEVAKDWVIENVLAEGEFSMLSGQPGCGKSFISVDWACHIGAGMEWHGNPVNRGFVLYVAAERADEVRRRIVAFKTKHDVSGMDVLVYEASVDFTAKEDDAKRVSDIVYYTEKRTGLKCSLIIVDTLTMSFGGKDQNSSMDMGRYIKSCKRLQRETRAHVAVVHHSTHAGERAKGAIDLKGAVDVSFFMKEGKSSVRSIDVDKANGQPTGILCHFKLEEVDLGMQAGKAISSFVVAPVPSESLADKLVSKMKAHQDVLHELATSMVDEKGQARKGLLREAFYRAFEGEKTDTLLKRFNKALNALEKGGRLECVGDMILIRPSA